MHKRRIWSAFEDEQIIEGDKSRRRGTNKRLALRFGVLATAISARADQLGCPPLFLRQLTTAYRGGGWSDPEKKLVIDTPMEPAAEVVEMLVAAGYPRRTPAAIGSLRVRLRKKERLATRQNALADQDQFTTPDLCAGLGCKPWRVAQWVQAGKLTATRIGGNQEYVVHRQALFRFLRDYVSSWDHRAADRWFLVDILACTRPNRKVLEAARQARGNPDERRDLTMNV